MSGEVALRSWPGRGRPGEKMTAATRSETRVPSGPHREPAIGAAPPDIGVHRPAVAELEKVLRHRIQEHVPITIDEMEAHRVIVIHRQHVRAGIALTLGRPPADEVAGEDGAGHAVRSAIVVTVRISIRPRQQARGLGMPGRPGDQRRLGFQQGLGSTYVPCRTGTRRGRIQSIQRQARTEDHQESKRRD